MERKKFIRLVSCALQDDELFEHLNLLSVRTSLEELLDWNSDLADFLAGAWAVFPITEDSDKELMAALYAAQLPHDKHEVYFKPLEQWVMDNYNIFVR